jgi:hypothetical protein
MSYFIALGFLGIFAALGTALFFMLRGNPSPVAKSKRMAWALALRVAVSIFLFLSILVAWKLGLIQPTGLPVGR